MSTDEILATSPDTAKAYLEATSRGYTYAVESPKEAADILLKHAPELDANIIHQSQEYLASRFTADAAKWGVFDAQRWDGFFKWLWENNLLPSEIKAGEGFTNDYLPQ